MPFARLPFVNSIKTSPFPSGETRPMVGLRAKLTAKILPARSQAGPSISAVKLCSAVSGRATKSSSAGREPGTVIEDISTPMTALTLASGPRDFNQLLLQETVQYIPCNPRDVRVSQQRWYPRDRAGG